MTELAVSTRDERYARCMRRRKILPVRSAGPRQVMHDRELATEPAVAVPVFLYLVNT